MDRPPFGPLTVPHQGGIFPTDFSSRMPSADCLLAIADVAADPLQAAMFFVSPTEVGLVSRSRRPLHAEALVSRLPPVRRFILQSLRLSRGTPDCFRHVTVESTEWAAAFIQEAGNWGCHVCCLLTPHPSTPILTDGLSIRPVYTVRSAHIFASSFLQPVLTERISAFRYLSCYLSIRAGLTHAITQNS
jgi:hypothetical protein